jgi:predicted NAD/FAD-binding protein
MKIAVVGSGIAGLSAAWLLSQKHEVTLYEKAAHLGMDAHGLDLDVSANGARIDVPLRVFFDGLYPNLTALYTVLGIESQPINYSASFGVLDNRSYFRYDNYRLGRHSLPFLKGRHSISIESLKIGWEILRFFRRIPESLAGGLSDELTLADYIEQQGWSNRFAEGFLYPAFAGICTCSHERIRNYPARIILEYLNTGLLISSVRRVTQGTREVVDALARTVQTIHLDTEVKQVNAAPAGATVETFAGTSLFDHVVLATQANQSVRLLNGHMTEEREVLSAFQYETSQVVVHRDPKLAPQGGRPQWAPVNFLLENPKETPMATIWMNAIQEMPEKHDLFQTWNPIVDPDRELVLAESSFERPVVDAESLKSLQRLARLQEQPDRRIWFCGSYAARGIPLLESATHSALSVAERLGCRRPWRYRDDSED